MLEIPEISEQDTMMAPEQDMIRVIEKIPEKDRNLVWVSRGVFDPARTDIFKRAAAETGLEVVVLPAGKTHQVRKDRLDKPAVELMSSERDMTLFWKRVEELEAEAARKVG